MPIYIWLALQVVPPGMFIHLDLFNSIFCHKHFCKHLSDEFSEDMAHSPSLNVKQKMTCYEI